MKLRQRLLLYCLVPLFLLACNKDDDVREETPPLEPDKERVIKSQYLVENQTVYLLHFNRSYFAAHIDPGELAEIDFPRAVISDTITFPSQGLGSLPLDVFLDTLPEPAGYLGYYHQNPVIDSLWEEFEIISTDTIFHQFKMIVTKDLLVF